MHDVVGTVVDDWICRLGALCTVNQGDRVCASSRLLDLAALSCDSFNPRMATNDLILSFEPHLMFSVTTAKITYSLLVNWLLSDV